MMSYGRGFSFPGGCFGFGSGLWFNYVVGAVLLIGGADKNLDLVSH